MYEKYYGLNRQPFSLLPDPSFLFLSRQHVMALTLLKYSLMNKHAFTVITGEVGAGKTTLINQLLGEISNKFTVGLINFTDERVTQFLPWILQAFDLPHSNKSSVGMYETFLEFIQEESEKGRTTLLVVDEAQNLARKALEKLRMFSNVNTKEILLQLVLVGQPEFRETLKRPDFRQLNQRVSVFYRLKPFNLTETSNYIRHRMAVAGGSEDTFQDDAASLIWKESAGIPRTINTLCDMALVYAFSNQKTRVDRSVVEEMLEDRRDLAVQTDASMHSHNGIGSSTSTVSPLQVVREYPTQ